jgi:hypothetical protein
MGFPIGKELVFKYEYDFAVSGGAVSSIALVNKGINALASGLIITDFMISVETTLAGTATPTITLGNAGDTDGYAVDFFGAGAAGAVITKGDRAGALVWDDTNDHAIYYKIDSSANSIPTITIATQALTAGKFQVYFKAFKAS